MSPVKLKLWHLHPYAQSPSNPLWLNHVSSQKHLHLFQPRSLAYRCHYVIVLLFGWESDTKGRLARRGHCVVFLIFIWRSEARGRLARRYDFVMLLIFRWTSDDWGSLLVNAIISWSKIWLFEKRSRSV